MTEETSVSEQILDALDTIIGTTFTGTAVPYLTSRLVASIDYRDDSTVELVVRIPEDDACIRVIYETTDSGENLLLQAEDVRYDYKKDTWVVVK